MAAELGALELKLLDVELENEALRAQLVTSGIEPQVWREMTYCVQWRTRITDVHLFVHKSMQRFVCV